MVARSEIGWHLTGWQRVIQGACRLARLQLLDDGDLYKQVAMKAALGGASWCSLCSNVLSFAGVQEWSAVVEASTSCGSKGSPD